MSTTSPLRPQYTLFMGGIPTSTSHSELTSLFSKFKGSVSIGLPLRTDMPQFNKGFAFVTVRDNRVYSLLLDSVVQVRGRAIKITGTATQWKNCQRRVYLKGIPYHLSDEALTAELCGLCDCISAYAVKDSYGCSLGYGYLVLGSRDECERLVALGSLAVAGRLVEVQVTRKEQVMQRRAHQKGAKKPKLPAKAPFSEAFSALRIQPQSYRDDYGRLGRSIEEMRNLKSLATYEQLGAVRHLSSEKEANNSLRRSRNVRIHHEHLSTLNHLSSQRNLDTDRKMKLRSSQMMKIDIIYTDQEIRFNFGRIAPTRFNF